MKCRYRTAFLCSSIYSTTSNEEDDILGLELTAAWKQDVLDMRNTAMLYEKLAESIAPGIYGHVGDRWNGLRIERYQERYPSPVDWRCS